jgi:hypothetical protein
MDLQRLRFQLGCNKRQLKGKASKFVCAEVLCGGGPRGYAYGCFDKRKVSAFDAAADVRQIYARRICGTSSM